MSVKNPTSYVLSIYDGSTAAGEPLRIEQGQGDDWQQLTVMSLYGFSGSATLKLHEFWQAALTAASPRFEQQVEGLETIVKFGNTMQLRPEYTLVLEAEYE